MYSALIQCNVVYLSISRSYKGHLLLPDFCSVEEEEVVAVVLEPGQDSRGVLVPLW